MKKFFIKTFSLILFTSLFLISFTSNVEAFLEGDLGLNMYNDLDDGLKEFEEKMYVYELSGQDKQNISLSINKILSSKGIGSCLTNGVNANIVQSIAEGDIKVLLANMKEECYDSDKQEFSSKKIGDIVSELGNIKNYYLNIATQKAKAIHEISRIGIYSDGNTNNSSFDIIKDINDINKILFTKKIEYNYEDYDFLKKYQQNKTLIGPLSLIGTLGNNGGNDNSNTNNTSNNNSNDNGSNGGNDNINNGGEIYGGINNELNYDSNIYACPTDNNETGLNDNSLKNLIGEITGKNGGNKNGLSKNGGHTPLPKTNIISNFDFNSQLVSNGIIPYKERTDKKFWDCSEYFCVKVNKIVRNQRALDYGVSHSIENIIETSNKHLKKAANTSLVQSKMTTNNFEISLRDLNLPDMFHMGINLSYKSPPILNLNELPGDSVKQMLIQKYKNFGLDYNNPNNLNTFNQKLRKIKGFFSTAENPSNRGLIINKELDKILKLRNKILNFNKEILHKDINNDILKNFEIQFKEVSQFNTNIMNYVYNLDTLVKNLKDIPIFSG